VGDLAAVDDDLGAGDERRLVGDQEDDERRHLLGGADAPEGVARTFATLNAGGAEAVIGVSM